MAKLRQFNIQIPEMIRDLEPAFEIGQFCCATARAAFVAPGPAAKLQLILGKITLTRQGGGGRAEQSYPEVILAAASLGIADFFADLSVGHLL